MASPDPTQLPLLRVATHGDSSREARALRRGAERGLLHRVRRGVYVDLADWTALEARGRHVVTVRASVAGASPGIAVSHESAVALHGLPTVGRRLDDIVRTIDEHRSTVKRTPTFLVRPGLLPDDDVVEVAGVRVTSLLRTAADMARTASFAEGVLCVDAVLRRIVLGGEHRDGPDVDETLTQVRAALVSRVGPPGHKGGRAARRIIAFASPWAENGGESLLRIALHELGVAQPVLQKVFRLHGRVVARADVQLPDGAVLEFDGMEKLVDGRMLAGRSTAQALREQKARDRALLALPDVRTVIHCDYVDVVRPEQLAELLRAGGVSLDPRRIRAAARAARARFDGVGPR